MALTLRLEKKSALTYKELDDNFAYLQTQLTTINNSLFRTSPLSVGPCTDGTFNWSALSTLNTTTGYSYWAKQACSSSFPWWTGSAGKGILAAETYSTLDPGNGFLGSLAFGQNNTLGGVNAFVHGSGNSATGTGAHAEGLNTFATTAGSHTEGNGTYTENNGSYAHAEGYNAHAQGQYSHAEGENTYAYSRCSHAEGYQTYAGVSGILSTSDEGKGAHSEGRNTYASGAYSHTEGEWTKAFGWASHAEGMYTTASFSGSHAEGWGTSTGLNYQQATGRFNLLNNNDDFFVIGVGALGARANGFGVNATRMYASNSIYFPNLTNPVQTNVLTYNPTTGQVFYTSSSAIGGAGNPLAIKDEGATLSSAATSINFIGSGITATNVGSAITVNVPGTTNLPIKDEGVTLTNSPSYINFTGTGVTATSVANAVTVNIPGTVNMAITDEGTLLTTSPTLINFTGPGVTATAVGNNVTVNVPTSSLTIKDEGISIITNPSTINFTGVGVTTTNVGGTATVNIPSISVYDEGSLLTTSPTAIDFSGSGIEATLSGTVVKVYVPDMTTYPAQPVYGVQWNDNGQFGADNKFKYNPSLERVYMTSLSVGNSFIVSDYKTVNSGMSPYTALDNDYVIISTPSTSGTIVLDLGSISITGQILTIKNSNVQGNGTTRLLNCDIDGGGTIDLTDSNSSVTIMYIGGGVFNILSSYKY